MPLQRGWIWLDPFSFIEATLWHRLRSGRRLTGRGIHWAAVERMRRRGLDVSVLGVVLVLREDRGHRAQPVHGDRAGPEHLRDRAGQVQDGRRDAVGAR